VDLSFTPEQEALREEVRAWAESEVPDEYDGSDEYPDPEWVAFDRQFTKKLADKGWLTMDWPEEYGGGRYGIVEQAIIHKELAYRRAPGRIQLVGLHNVAPALFDFGTEEQRIRFLPGIQSGAESWANALTEQDAGSDLANLKTSAERADGEWVVNGEKTLNTRAYYCDWFWTAVRTNKGTEDRHDGISVLVVPKGAPGVEIIPTKAMNGHQLSTIRFNDVHVPAENLVGNRDTAWREALTSTSTFTGVMGNTERFRRLFDDVIRRIRVNSSLRRMVREDSRIQGMLAQLKVEFAVQEYLYWKRVCDLARDLPPKSTGKRTGGGVQDVTGSASSLWGKEWGPRFTEAMMALVGKSGLLLEEDPEWGLLSKRIASLYLSYRATHSHGTPEVLRNVIAYRRLHLPRSLRNEPSRRTDQVNGEPREISPAEERMIVDWEVEAEEDKLRHAAHEILTEACPPSVLLEQFSGGAWFSQRIWRVIAEHGWTALLVPVEYGGGGAGVLQAALIAEQLGYVNAPVPYTSSSVEGVSVVAHSRAAALGSKLLPEVASGGRILAMAQDSGRVVAQRVVGGVKLSGQVGAVLDAPISTDFIVGAEPARMGDDAILVAVPASRDGVEVKRQVSLGAGEVGSVRFGDVEIGPEDVLATGKPNCEELITAARQRGAIVAAAEMLGGTRKVFELTLEYAKNRTAFRRPIAVYQAISHKVVDILWELDSMVPFIYGTAWKLDQGLDAGADAAGVKAYCGPVYERACSRSHDVLAGVGYLLEHPLHLYTRRAKILDISFGDGAWQQAKVLDSLGI
jgi:alkylation response protein AidB-like acyl-CoA dehydrogenase